MRLQNFDGSSAEDSNNNRSERVLSRSIDGLAAVSIGLLVALGFWLWQTGGESVAIAAILNGLANCL